MSQSKGIETGVTSGARVLGGTTVSAAVADNLVLGANTTVEVGGVIASRADGAAAVNQTVGDGSGNARRAVAAQVETVAASAASLHGAAGRSLTVGGAVADGSQALESVSSDLVARSAGSASISAHGGGGAILEIERVNTSGAAGATLEVVSRSTSDANGGSN